MKKWLIVVFLSSPVCLGAFAQAKISRGVQTSVCEIVTHPQQFEGKSVRVRAQIWTNWQRFWLNDSAASSHQFGKACRWLPAEFAHPTILAGSTAFATFTGRLVRDSTSSGRMLFLIESESEIYRQQVLNGLILTPALFDGNSNTFFKPE